MNIIVCVKQVPNTTEIKIDPVTNTLIREGVESILNPFDAYAVEEAVRMKERYGGMVTAICMGPNQAEETLRETVAVGVDNIFYFRPSFCWSRYLSYQFDSGDCY
jgi:electron transfer flavoprotein beta subunit